MKDTDWNKIYNDIIKTRVNKNFVDRLEKYVSNAHIFGKSEMVINESELFCDDLYRHVDQNINSIYNSNGDWEEFDPDIMDIVSEWELEKSFQRKAEKKKCKHEDAYLNVVSANLKFWVCPDCKEELPPEFKK